MSNDVFDPPACRDMKILDRARFRKTVALAAAKIEPRQIPAFRQHCAQDILKQARLRAIYDKDGQKLVALRPGIDLEESSTLHESTQSFMEKEHISLVQFDLDLTYDYWQADDILAAILPESLIADSPAGFTMVGHIAHMNLRDEYLPYKHIIGQVILDKNSAIRTVVNKLDTIDTVYRNFQMEILAGDDDFVAEQSESGCRFRFDFSKVYWNSRLHTEHERLVKLFQPGEAVCDLMAGVGPFAIPAGKKKVLVFANDLNPASYAALLDNIDLNKVTSFVFPSNIDGREYIRESQNMLEKLKATQAHVEMSRKQPPRKKLRGEAQSTSDVSTKLPIPTTFKHYVMNLPASAIDFLDGFRGLYSGRSDDPQLPMIHVHCFTKFEEQAARVDLSTRISARLGQVIDEKHIHFHHVRRVAPSKDMYCCTFELPAEVAFASHETSV